LVADAMRGGPAALRAAEPAAEEADLSALPSRLANAALVTRTISKSDRVTVLVLMSFSGRFITNGTRLHLRMGPWNS
jgi:hypothetical protein